MRLAEPTSGVPNQLESSDPFPQLGIKQAYVPAASSTNIAYKPCSDCLRARVRLTICGPQLDRLLDVTSPHGRTMRGLWLLCEGTHALYQSITEKATVVLADFKRFHKLESSTSHKLPSSLIPTCGNCLIPS
ncbi:hypothetical protein PRIPAC_93225 [Pristionchus pacificus]|uniref:Uncharacterized protein n=1 Tax=Pristionchus pacificus TaxID=54126 RepID=A0A2A6CD13_PRIPA|nr:hypothetical protein PRIPAC_93225 [Pristionchus pacificus]|eukprot:PDM76084.1 hypothetical protein PRIPAC_39688 [Pristionchus pacificus]